MKHIFTYLLILSVGVNVYFLVKKLEYNKQNEAQHNLHFWKKISHKEGYSFYKNKMKTDFKETYSGQKTAFICFWDSLGYDFVAERTMKIMDSLATETGEHAFDYIFATEMDQEAAKSFLKSRGIEFKNFKILGGMDDFISGVFNEKPVKWKSFSLGGKKDSIKPNPNCPDMSTMKVKPYYLLMDNKGQILYNSGKYWNPRMDTALIRRLNSNSATKTLKNIDY
jgi:hypothetical protein